MTFVLDPRCPHPTEAILVAIKPDTGDWTATCPRCSTEWLRGTGSTPDSVRAAVLAAAGMAATLTVDEARKRGYHVATIGDPYLPPSPLKLGLRWIITPDDGVECGVYHDSLTPGLVDAFHSGPTEFALVRGNHALMLAARVMRAAGWWDGSWQAARQIVAGYPAGLVAPEPGKHLPVRLVLVDSTTGLIRAMRLVTWPHHFHTAVFKAVQAQLDHRSTVADGDREIALWLRRYPEPRLLVRDGAKITCRGGADDAVIR